MQTQKLLRVFSLQPPVTVSRCAFWPIVANVCLVFAMFTTTSEVSGHEFEDGFVERSVAVVVRGNVARLEYSIGLNPNTRQQLIEFWQTTSCAIEPTESGQAPETEPKQQKPDFYQLAATHLSRRLRILVNNQPVRTKIISALQSSKHHVDATVSLEFVLPAADALVPIAIEISDGNFFRKRRGQQEITPEPIKTPSSKTFSGFAQTQKISGAKPHLLPAPLLPAPFGGGFRYAFKTKGSTALNRSNVASILIRADRHLDDDFTDAQLDIAFKIKAQVSYISKTSTKQ